LSGDAADGDLYQVTVTANTKTSFLEEIESCAAKLVGQAHW
jgi:hypothetical protein